MSDSLNRKGAFQFIVYSIYINMSAYTKVEKMFA